MIRKYYPFIIVAALFCFVIYWVANMLNPDSFFCLYQIYKQPNGTYEVWWNCKTRTRKLSGVTYEQAKAFQIKECEELKTYELQRPRGERVK